MKKLQPTRKTTICLASKSPRRRQLIETLGLDVRVVEIDVDETIESAIPVGLVAEKIACKKSSAYDKSLLYENEVLVTADTIVALDGKVLGKPQDHEQAVAMLSALSGRKHTVYTGICLATKTSTRSFSEKTDVYFRTFEDDEIQHYVDTYKPYDKAGAYGIQEWIGMIGTERIEGCYYNVMGLPVARLYKELRHIV